MPYTIDVYDADKRAYRRGEFGLGIALFGGFALAVSGLLYLTGFTVAWIRRGFHKPV